MSIHFEKLQYSDRVSDAGLLAALAGSGEDFAWYGGRDSGWTIIPLKLRRTEWRDVCDRTWSETVPIHELPFAGGFAGIIPYETFSPFADGPPPVLFRAAGALLRKSGTDHFVLAATEAGEFAEVRTLAAQILAVAERAHSSAVHQSGDSALTPECSNDSYEQKVNEALEDIRNGRFYQINLLRYFKIPGLDEQKLVQLITSRGGPYSSWIRQGDTDVISFSPEHFVEVNQRNGAWTVTTSPIKGTAARSPDPALDNLAKEALLTSNKDHAELHMIIDLMRNDLNRICEPASVTVKESSALRSFVNVHHLVGRVEGRLRHGLSLNEFLQAVCPAGSITGAPKIEVMHAIRDYEGRKRSYFMGNAFLLDTCGRFDSSVLIRTVAGNRGKNYEFSAGSGIVMSSDPHSERLEIEAKCNVLIPEGQSRWP